MIKKQKMERDCVELSGPGLPDLSWHNIPKRENIPNGHKMYQMATNCTKWPQIVPNGHKIYQLSLKYTYQTAIKYSSIFHYKTLQNLPKMGIWFENIHIHTYHAFGTKVEHDQKCFRH
jgi:hypothetical protein